MLGSIFIGYSHADIEFATKLTKSLETAGYNIWLDRMDIQAGTHQYSNGKKYRKTCDQWPLEPKLIAMPGP